MRSNLKIFLAFLGLAIPVLAHGKELGRLFFMPEQRAQLDHGYAPEAGSDHTDQGLILNGIVQKHGGKRTVWINGVPQLAGSSDEKTPDSQQVTVPGKSKQIRIKVGQRVLLSPSANSDAIKPDTPKQDTPQQ